MSTTSPNFNFILATTADTVNVVSHIATNFSAIDTLMSQSLTGTGQFKPNLTLSSPSITAPTIVGTMTGGTIISTTGRFNTITATGGALTVNSFNIGTYSYPTTASADALILTLVTGNARWAANAPGTGAATDLANLAAVAINTNMNAFTAAKVTLTTLQANTVTATGGALSGLTTMNSTTGTFAANLTVIGTVHAGVVNATGGTITAGGFSIGTYAYPATVGATGGMLRVTTGNLVFVATPLTTFNAWSTGVITGFNSSGAFQATADGVLYVTLQTVDGSGDPRTQSVSLLSDNTAVPVALRSKMSVYIATTATHTVTLSCAIRKDDYAIITTSNGSWTFATSNFLPIKS